MPTAPNKNIIPNEEEYPDTKRILSHLSSLIDEMVNFGSWIFGWCLEKKLKGDYYAAPIILYRRSLELLDSISLLIKSSSVAPCKVMLRSLFETMMFLEYMTQDDFENRGRDFILCVKHKELYLLRQHLPEDPLYKEYIPKFSRDNLAKYIPIPRIPDLKAKIAVKMEFVNSSFYTSSQESYQAIAKQRKSRSPKWWFNLHGGPNDLKDLADKLNRPLQYEVLYREWAGYAHGTGSFDGQVEVAGPETLKIIQLRLPENAEFITMLTLGFETTIFKTMINQYAKEREPELSAWFEAELKEEIEKLKNTRIFVI